MHTIKALTIDFWNTLVDSSNGALRREARNLSVRRVYDALQRDWDEHAVNEAFRVAYETFERHWYGEQRTLSADETVAILWEQLDLAPSRELHQHVVRSVELSILDGMPALLPGAGDALRRFAQTRSLALISDTAMSPGSVLRSVLEQHGVADLFSAMVFSDETGVSKPHPLAFETALSQLGVSPEEAAHIGDIERTDIVGAHAAGMRSILFRGDSGGRYHHEQDSERTLADAVAHNWAEVERIIEDWEARRAAGKGGA
jgi:FMN hydrolase / 5-amino-6-(5-phospho-D-ribitylamino)uracil phosphatase